MHKIKIWPKFFGIGQKGFTLIELLVVIAILGILAAIAVPAVSGFIGSSEEPANDTELREVQTAVVACLTAAGQTELDNAAGYADVTDLSGVTATDLGPDGAIGGGDDTVYTVAQYMTGLEDTDNDGYGDTTKLDVTYDITADGIVTQN